MASLINEIGNKYHSLTVVERGPNNKYGDARWYCQCDCGNRTLVVGYMLRRGSVKSCGCSHKLQSMKDLTGQKFGRLTALKYTERRSSEGQIFWLCKCECGSIVEVKSGNLISGYSKSCGCIRSRGEERIIEVLKENNIRFQKEKTFSNLYSKKKLRFDFAILDDNLNPVRLIEFDGVQHTDKSNPWHSADLQEHDELKNQYSKDNNIPLVRIPYYLRDTVTIEDIMGDKYLII